MAKGGISRSSIKNKLSRWANRISPTLPSEQNGGMSMPPSASGDTAFRLSGILTLAIFLLVVLFGVLIGTRVYSVMGMGSNKYKNIPLVYTMGDGTLKYTSNIMDQTVTVSGETGTGIYNEALAKKSIVLSDDGKKLLYMQNLNDDAGNLWLTSIINVKGNEKINQGQLVAERIIPGSASFTEGNKSVVYLRKDLKSQMAGGVHELCRWTAGGGEEILDVNVCKIDFIAGKNICYLREDDKKMELCLLSFPEKSGQQPNIQIVDSGVFDTVSVDENNAVTYIAMPETGDMLVRRWDGKNISNLGILKPAQGIVTADNAGIVDIGLKGELFYLQSERSEFKAMQYFEDDKVAEDAHMTEPTEKEYIVEKKNLWGQVSNVLDKAAYEAAVEAYNEKLKRDEIRATIKSKDYDYTTYTLCHTVGNSATIVDTGITSVEAGNAEAATAVYYKEHSAIAEKFPLSKVVDSADALRMIDTVKQNTVRDYYYAKLGIEPLMFQTANRNEQLVVMLDGGKGLYTLKGPVNEDVKPASSGILGDEGGVLYYSAMEDDGLSGAKKIDDKVIALEKQKYNEQFIYRKISGTDLVDLWGVAGGKKSQMVSGISQNSYFTIYDDALLTYKNYHEGREAGDAVLYDGKTKFIGDDTHNCSYRTPKYIYLLTNYDIVLKTGDLYLYTGNSKKLKLLDSGVSMLVNE